MKFVVLGAGALGCAMGSCLVEAGHEVWLINRRVDRGQTVAASLQAPTLFTIAQDLTKMQIDTNVDESDIGRTLAGQQATFTVDAVATKSSVR